MGSALEKIFQDIAVCTDEARDEGRSHFISIDGLDCSGKTRFARGLAWFLGERYGSGVELIHVDDYKNHDVQARIYEHLAAGRLTLCRQDQFYEDGIDFIRAREEIGLDKRLHDGAVVIIEGVFVNKLFRGEMLDSIYLDVSPDIAEQRYFARREAEKDTRSSASFRALWLPVFERYNSQYAVRHLSNTIIDNNDYSHPRIVYESD